MSKRGGYSVFFALLLLSLFLHMLQHAQIEELQQTLNRELSYIQNDVNGLSRNLYDLDKLEDRVSELERPEPDPLLESYSFSIRQVDTTARTLTLDTQAYLHVKDLGAAVEVLVNQMGQVSRFPLECGSSGFYQGSISLSLEDPSRGAYFQVTARDGGESRAEELCSLSDLTSLLPVSLKLSPGKTTYENGTLFFTDWDICLSGTAENSGVVRVYVNGTLAQELPLTGSLISFSQPCAEGDTLELRYAARDKWGLFYEFPSQWWEVKAGKTQRHFPTSTYPSLVWPQ